MKKFLIVALIPVFILSISVLLQQANAQNSSEMSISSSQTIAELPQAQQMGDDKTEDEKKECPKEKGGCKKGGGGCGGKK